MSRVAADLLAPRLAWAWRPDGTEMPPPGNAAVMAEIEHRIVDFLLAEKTEVLNIALPPANSDILADVQGA